MIEAPDYIEPVEGWRVWAVVDDRGEIRLRSLFYDSIWEPGTAAYARCEHRQFTLRHPWRRRRSDHEAPESKCRCGIHASFRPVTVMPYFRLHTPGERCRAIGRVALWGDIVECEAGYRAQRAYPIDLFLPEPRRVPGWPSVSFEPREVAAELACYGVPIEILPARVDRAILPLLPAS